MVTSRDDKITSSFRLLRRQSFLPAQPTKQRCIGQRLGSRSRSICVKQSGPFHPISSLLKDPARMLCSTAPDGIFPSRLLLAACGCSGVNSKVAPNWSGYWCIIPICVPLHESSLLHYEVLQVAEAFFQSGRPTRKAASILLTGKIVSDLTSEKENPVNQTRISSSWKGLNTSTWSMTCTKGQRRLSAWFMVIWPARMLLGLRSHWR